MLAERPALRALELPRTTESAADRLEHLALCLPEQLEGVRRSGVDVVTNPGFLVSRAKKYAHELTSLEQDWLYPVRSLMRKGVHVAAASDAPVTDASPLETVQAAVRRGEDATRFASAEAVGLGAALGMVTHEAARVMDASPGLLRRGTPADFVVLAGDPLVTDPAALPDVQVLGTFRSGVPIFAAPELLERMDGVAVNGSVLTPAAGALGLV
jgi:predicted amidohydrolase YtcJ